MAAVQGQEYAQTKWGLVLRLPVLDDSDIERDFAAGKILRTHLLRPTWHIVSAKDIRWLLHLTAPRVHQANAFMYRKLELTDTVFEKCQSIITTILQGGKQLTRNDINAAFKENKIIAAGHRLSYIMMHAELDGLVCSGARNGNQFTYALLEDRVRREKDLDRDEALAELTKRYFSSRGPATVNDFATRSGLTLTDCRSGIEMNKRRLKEKAIAGVNYFFLDSDSKATARHGGIYLLPIYDELIMGYKNRDALLEFKRENKQTSGFQYDSMIVCEGQIIGTWRRVFDSKSIEISAQFFQPLTPRQSQAFDDAVNQFGKFTGIKVRYSPPN